MEFPQKKYIPVLLIALLTPLVGLYIYMMVWGVGFNEISVPCTDWNDEFYYYKMIQGMVDYGIPQGYFGYNESHAIIGNLGGWSVAMLLPYAFIGRIFGWNYMTPIIINIVLWMFGLGLFAIGLKPTVKQMLIVSAVWLSFAINIRYMLSATPEALVNVLFLIYAIGCISFIRNQNNKTWLILADFSLVWLTLIRGYYVIFAVILMAAIYKENKKIDVNFWSQLIVALVAAIGFVCIAHFMFAAYFTPDIAIDTLINPKALVKKNLICLIESLKYIKQCILMQSMKGSWYLLYFLSIIYLIYRCVINKDIVNYSLLLAWLGLLFAMWTLYRPEEGCRHFMAAILVLAMFLPLYENKKIIIGICVVVFLYTTWLCKEEFYMRLIPEDANQIAALEDGQTKLDEVMKLGDNEWDNTVIFTRITYFNDLYAIPSGFGINCCIDDYVREHFDELNSKYIAYRAGGDLDDFLAERCELVATYGTTNMYKIR
ncbi:hypothetical protein [Pseudobutyrivibrio xylanivorans]|uniref:Dolichyl-phosphate-mannose-protein mannosyltransferase n=1 Tax=Pseudobutyrivibrio xylanivorans DSM 14809 TaxID=1123012 RepID=A0A1M6GVQ2_PSEXY|nr:hypothetical protein [Pseudobutyrivibrio xylanivorans]SHJ14022.1 hypothetical protein SAMN02745725_01841 [Pseudobutyrivibrio xylanivorans DSM 14809]